MSLPKTLIKLAIVGVVVVTMLAVALGGGLLWDVTPSRFRGVRVVLGCLGVISLFAVPFGVAAFSIHGGWRALDRLVDEIVRDR